MKDLLRIASLLDNSGQFHLSDKLFRIAQSSPRQIADANAPYKSYPTNPNNIRELRNKLVPTDFRGVMYQDSKGDNLLNTSDIKSFAVGLMEYARIYNFPNLQTAFDAYANNGAKFRGQNINNVPQLKELYTRISQTTDSISRKMVEEELRNIFRTPQTNPDSTNVPQNNTGFSTIGNAPGISTTNNPQNPAVTNVS